jgi:hypothetical protein
MKIAVFVESARIGLFFELLCTGILVETPTGLSVREFLYGVLGLEHKYVDTRIQTVFLNGRALDDIDGAILENGSVLALSGAMPGLAGAVFRRGGAYATLRSNVGAAPKPFIDAPHVGSVIVKLFNQTAADLGPMFFKKGIRVKGHMLSQFLQHNLEKLQNIQAFIEVEGKKHTFSQVSEMAFDVDDVRMTIEASQTDCSPQPS